MKQVTIYTDGACSGNPGPGGWSAILIYRESRLELSGYEAHTTNNRMELMGPIMALSKLKESCEVLLHSDSSYLINAFEKHWLENWQQRNWVTSTKKPVENQDLWKQLLSMTQKHQVRWIKVRGHSDVALNNRCDELARGEIRQHAGRA